MPDDWTNKLFFGDNLQILREHVADASVDLIYLDPPFNSNASYNVLFEEKSGEQSAAQIQAFDDTWHWGLESELAYAELVTQGPQKLRELLQALRAFLGTNDMMAYLTMMAARLVELHRVLKPTGSIYLHCDPTASHYLKIVMDAIFGFQFFRNEITWKRVTAHSDSKKWSADADLLLYYSQSDRVAWNPQYSSYSDAYLLSKYRFEDPDGRRYRLDNMTSPNPRPNMMYEWKGHQSPPKGWRYSKETMAVLDAQGRIWYPDHKSKRPQLKRYLDEQEGVLLGTVWTDINPINSRANERLGYPTQKPEALLERILQASSNEGDLVLDPFCGCGTTIAVAERLQRRWIGIDITHLAISLMRHRLHDAFGEELKPYEVIGDPKDLAGADALAAQDKYQFQWWALGLVDARPAADQRKKGADAGIDGSIYFFDDDSGRAKRIILSVKGGNVNVGMVRDLKGVLEREKAPIGVFITLQRPTRPMREEALAAGFYEPATLPGRQFERIQILTIEELLGGAQVQYPHRESAVTFKRATRQRRRDTGQGKLL